MKRASTWYFAVVYGRLWAATSKGNRCKREGNRPWNRLWCRKEGFCGWGRWSVNNRYLSLWPRDGEKSVKETEKPAKKKHCKSCICTNTFVELCGVQLFTISRTTPVMRFESSSSSDFSSFFFNVSDSVSSRETFVCPSMLHTFWGTLPTRCLCESRWITKRSAK